MAWAAVASGVVEQAVVVWAEAATASAGMVAEKEEAAVPVARWPGGSAEEEEAPAEAASEAEDVEVVASAAVATEVEAEAVEAQGEAAMGEEDWEMAAEEAAEAGPAGAA